MTEPNQNQLWRDQLDKLESVALAAVAYVGVSNHAERETNAFTKVKNAFDEARDNPVPPCNCSALREALEMILANCVANRESLWFWTTGANVCAEALAATPYTSGGKTDEAKANRPSDYWYSRCLKSEADREQWKERALEAERWKKEQLEVESQWDAQEVAKVMGLTLGRNIRPHILPFIQKLIAERSWIPLHGPGSRRPTEQDSDQVGYVCYRSDNHVWVGLIGDRNAASHFHPLSKFAPAPDPDTEKEWTLERQPGCYVILNRHDGTVPVSFLAIYDKALMDIIVAHNSALAHRDAQQKEKK